MEFYKLPDKFGDYSLDYCTEIEGYSYKIDFAYKGKEGSYYKGKINFGDKEYPADKDHINSHSNAFTKEDIPMLIAMARGFYIRQFPFKTESGEIVCLSIDNYWLGNLGTSILKIDNRAKCYSFRGGGLYIDNKQIDILNFCQLYKLKDGTYGYGVQEPKDKVVRIAVSDALVFGCKADYLKVMLPYLPLKYDSGYIDLCKGVSSIDSILDEAGELSITPLYKVTEWKESIDSDDSMLISYGVEESK